jgi:cyanophycin synthetase
MVGISTYRLLILDPLNMNQTLLSQLRHNQRCLVEELLRRNIEVTLISKAFELVEATWGDKRELLVDVDSSLIASPAATIANNKAITKKLLIAAGINTTHGQEFESSNIAGALECFDRLNGPVVVKPSIGTGGDEVHINLESQAEVSLAMESIEAHLPGSACLLEEFYEGNEYRIFITRRGDFAALYREPAYVVGDGQHTLFELARRETARRKNPDVVCLAPVIMNHIAESFLNKQGLGFSYVPKAAEKVYVRPNSNVGTGGVCHDFTDKIHPSVIGICRKVLESFPGLPYAGIDFMCRDASLEQSYQSYRIIEVNPLPSLGIHMTPAMGKERNVAGMLVEMMFPGSGF